MLRTYILLAFILVLFSCNKSEQENDGVNNVNSETNSEVFDPGTLALPSNFFKDFPPITYGMGFENVKTIILNHGGQPETAGNSELTWHGTFDGTIGTATVILDQSGILYGIVVNLSPLNEFQSLSENIISRLKEMYGEPLSKNEDGNHLALVWHNFEGVLIELIILKVPDDKTITVHWVKLGN